MKEKIFNEILYVLHVAGIYPFFYQSVNMKTNIGKPVFTQKLEKLPHFMKYQVILKQILIFSTYPLIITFY